MPNKKQPKNAFYFYMLDFKDEQAQIGINYENLAAVAEAAGDKWKDLPANVRAKYENKAKNHKKNAQGQIKKYTSNGIPIDEILRLEKEMQEAERLEMEDITNMIRMKNFNLSIAVEDFYIMDVNVYCKTTSFYVIAEFTILCFNLQEGIKSCYHELINPGRIPVGYASDTKISCTELGLDMPDETKPPTNYMQILANMIDFLKSQDENVKTLPPIYTMPDKVEPICNFIHLLCCKAGEDETLFRIYKLDTMFFTLINEIKTRSDEGFPKFSLALLQLKKDLFKYSPGLACQQHEERDKSIECTESRTKRWAYIIHDSCCPLLGIPLTPGKHLPDGVDVERVLAIKEQKKERPSPSVAQATSSSCDLNRLNEDFGSKMKLSSRASDVSSECSARRRVHEPLRMPKDRSSHIMRLPPALDEDDFPALGAIGRGRGRGGRGAQ